MAAVPITITGILFDKHGRTQQLVTLMGEASYTGLGVGGGPMPPGQGGGEQPPGIWGGADSLPPWAMPPIHYPPSGGGGKPPGIWGGADSLPPWAMPPIFYPPQVPPSLKPPEAPEPGSPTTAVPGNWPVQPIAAPEYLIVNYPGIGPVVVAPPVQGESAPTPEPKQA